jgi:addiction module RelE/StbE family toxin
MTKKYRVIVPPSVTKDLREIVEFYYEVNRSYSKKIFTKIIGRIRELENFPLKGRIVPELKEHNIDAYRELIEENYRIIYKIFDEEVLLISVIDARRNVEEVLIRKLQRK